jgi:hypothetical protein
MIGSAGSQIKALQQELQDEFTESERPEKMASG